MGLAVTEYGGMLLPVEVVTMVGKGDLLITGQLGDVMRESAVASFTYVRSRAKSWGLTRIFKKPPTCTFISLKMPFPRMAPRRVLPLRQHHFGDYQETCTRECRYDR